MLLSGGFLAALAALLASIRRENRDVRAGRRRRPIEAGIHTSDSVQRRQRAAIGPATAALYGLIGDTLDAGRWQKASDALLRVFRENPNVLADALVEWGFLLRFEEDDGYVFYEEAG